MRIILIIIFLLTCFISVHSQQLYIGAGKSISTFDYRNSQNEKLENLQSTDHTNMSLGVRERIFIKNLLLNIGLHYNSYGATGSDKVLGNYFNWDLNYLGLGIGLDYQLIKKGKFDLYLKAALSGEILLLGTQTLNDNVYDLLKEEDFDSPFYFYRGGLGVQYSATDFLSFFTHYMYGTGNMFKDNQGDLKIKDHLIGFGLYFNISGKSAAILKNEQVTIVQSNDSSYDKKLESLKQELEQNKEKIKQLENNSQEVEELKIQLADKKNEIRVIKESITDALQPYKGNELSIQEIDGKVYIIMGNGMLFKSGNSKLSDQCINAINNLGTTLAKNRDLDILIVGHTDNTAFKNSSMNNWDLSIQRATSVVEILTKNKNIDPKNLTAAGKADQEPIADNATEEGKAKNRRIEIIISPKLEKLIEISK